MLQELIKSWRGDVPPLISTEDILAWIQKRISTLTVHITPNRLSDSEYWYFDEQQGCITNRNGGFFEIRGLQAFCDDKLFWEQPVIMQNEIGYLGILCKMINGGLYFLMQAKIEPGNINIIQISPTIQATKSNFTQKHGGRKPAYLDYFIHSSNYTILVDQIQSEQSSRFYKKRNRNIILLLDEKDEIEVLPTHKWMTLHQIKQLLKMDNVVNMDTRTVLSCLPFSLMDGCEQVRAYFSDDTLYMSMFGNTDFSLFPCIFNYLNDYRMFHMPYKRLVGLQQLSSWNMTDKGIYHKSNYNFSVIYCDIEVEGREVRRWMQPLFQARGIALFALFTKVQDERRMFLVQAIPEAGCFDGIELGPTIQREAAAAPIVNAVEAVLSQYIDKPGAVIQDVLLSEEGGRFYHEQNRNLILEIPSSELTDVPPGYFWMDFKALNMFVQINNSLNIQLRNLLSLLDL